MMSGFSAPPFTGGRVLRDIVLPNNIFLKGEDLTGYPYSICGHANNDYVYFGDASFTTILRQAGLARSLYEIAVPTTLADQTITLAGALTLPHGLGSEPSAIDGFLICQAADLNYSIGDVVPWAFPSPDIDQAVASRGIGVVIDATNVTVRFGVSGILVVNKTTGGMQTITPSSWKLRVKVYL